MKIEKLTENKIRVVIHSDELESNNLNVHNIMTKALETQDIFSTILKKAEKEVDFCTDGYKLLIEAFSSLEDVLVFTITKFLPDNEIKKKKLVAKRKSFANTSHQFICKFENFDTFCDFRSALQSFHKSNLSKLSKSVTLYLWKNSYYLVLNPIDTGSKNMNWFYSTLSEFGKLISSSDYFESKLAEHGDVIIPKGSMFKW